MHGRVFIEDENNVTDAPMQVARESGCITTWHKERGFGFVLSNAVTGKLRRSLFVHFGDYDGPVEDLRVGVRVTFERTHNQKGPRAVKVRMP